MKKYKHIIVSRVGLKWYENETTLRCETLGLTWDEWISDSIHLYDTYCRNSLNNQTNKDFILLSLFDESVEFFGNLIENEYILKVDNIGKTNKSISDFVENNISEEFTILSRIDRDDCYSIDFVENLQSVVESHIDSNDLKVPYYFDLINVHKYRIIDRNYAIFDYSKNTSPFTSIFGNTKNMPIVYGGHTRIKNKMPGIKLQNLSALQIIHNNNLLNKLVGYQVPRELIPDHLKKFSLK